MQKVTRLIENSLTWIERENVRSVVANLLGCEFIVSEIKFQCPYHVHFRTNTIGEMNQLLISSNGLNSYKKKK